MNKKLLILVTSLIITGCGGGGSDTSPITPTISQPVKTNIVMTMGNFDAELLGEAPLGFNGFISPHIWAVGDMNQDGYDDILLSNFSEVIGVTLKPTLLLYHPESHSYIVDERFKLATQRHMNIRRAAIVDLDGDGRNDIVIADTGVDQNPRCGYQNNIILNTKTGYVSLHNLFSNITDFSHGLAVGDFNGDKVNDIIFSNQNDSLNTTSCSEKYRPVSYAIQGALFKEMKVSINGLSNGQPVINWQYNRTQIAYSLLAKDLNGDGIDDLITGYSNHMTISESIGPNQFNVINNFTRPPSFEKYCATDCHSPYNSFIVDDLDNDGTMEIVASISYALNNGNDHNGGSFFQVLKKINGKWEDTTDLFFPIQNSLKPGYNLEWCHNIFTVDLNNDGKKDIVCSAGEARTFVQTNFWINQNNKFIPWQQIRDISDITASDAHKIKEHMVVRTKLGPTLIALKILSNKWQNYSIIGLNL